MRRELNRTFVDLSGRTIRFEYVIDADSPNRGFLVDRLEAYSGTDKVGYISCEYITRSSFEAFHPTVFNFMDQILGKLIMPQETPTLDLRGAEAKTLSYVASRLIGYRIARTMPEEPLADYQAFLQWLDTSDNAGNMARYETAYAAFARRINYPFVAYVSTRKNPHMGVNADNSGLGIGFELYRVMAAELTLRGMALRASKLQTPEAASIWRRFEQMGMAYREPDQLEDGTRLCLKTPELECGNPMRGSYGP